MNEVMQRCVDHAVNVYKKLIESDKCPLNLKLYTKFLNETDFLFREENDPHLVLYGKDDNCYSARLVFVYNGTRFVIKYDLFENPDEKGNEYYLFISKNGQSDANFLEESKEENTMKVIDCVLNENVIKTVLENESNASLGHKK